MSSGIYDYILSICQNDYTQLIRCVDREIANLHNEETIQAVSEGMKDSIEKIDLDEMTKLKEQVMSIVDLPNYQDIKDIVDKIK